MSQSLELTDGGTDGWMGEPKKMARGAPPFDLLSSHLASKKKQRDKRLFHLHQDTKTAPFAVSVSACSLTMSRKRSSPVIEDPTEDDSPLQRKQRVERGEQDKE